MRAHSLLLTSLMIVASGCSRETAPVIETRYEPEQARAALVSALDAWKKGEARTLRRRKPPIRFEDDDLATGCRLSDYELEEPDANFELHKDMSVILSLRDPQGRTVRREASYQVATVPAIAVIRSDR